MCTTMPHVDTAHTEHNKSRTKQNWERFQKKVLRRHKMRLQMGIMVKWTFNLNAASLEWCAKTVNARGKESAKIFAVKSSVFRFQLLSSEKRSFFFVNYKVSLLRCVRCTMFGVHSFRQRKVGIFWCIGLRTKRRAMGVQFTWRETCKSRCGAHKLCTTCARTRINVNRYVECMRCSIYGHITLNDR